MRADRPGPDLARLDDELEEVEWFGRRMLQSFPRRPEYLQATVARDH